MPEDTQGTQGALIVRLDQGGVNARILARESKADFRRVEAASVKIATRLHSAEGKRIFVRMFSTLQLNTYFISVIARTRMEHEDIHKIESVLRERMEAASKALGDAGYFDVKNDVWKEIAKDDPELSKFPTYYDWQAATEKEIRDSMDPGTPPSIADGIVAKVMGKIPVGDIYSKVSGNAEKSWLADHPKLAATAYQWGYLGSNPSKLERALAAAGSGQ